MLYVYFCVRSCAVPLLLMMAGVLSAANAPDFASRAVSAPITGVQPDFSTGQPEALVVVGQPYAYHVVLSGNPPPTLAVTTGPAGMVWNQDPLPTSGPYTGDYSTGTLTWTPTAAGAQHVVITASNSQGSKTQSWTVRAIPTPTARQIDGKDTLKVMCLGDSITCGWSLTVGGYRKAMGDLLRGAGYSLSFVGGTKEGSPSWCNPAGATDLNHEGHGGWTAINTASGQDNNQVAGLLSIVNGTYPNAGGTYCASNTVIDTYQPDVVILMDGTNDLGGSPETGSWDTTAKARMGALIDGIWARRPATRIVVMPIIRNTIRDASNVDYWNIGAWEGVDRPGGGTDWVSRAQAGTANVVTVRQRAGKPISFVDANRGSVDERSWDPRTTGGATGMTMDGVHPLASAYQNAMAQAAFRAVLDVTPGALGATVPPSAPSGPTAVANGAGLDVTWTSNSRNESGFEVDWSASPYFASFATIQSAAGTTAAALTGLPATTLIFVRVRAKNAGGASWYTPPVRMTTETGSGSGGGGAALPAAPSGLSAVAASSSQITLSWTDNATNETGFVIERRSGSAVFAQVATVGAGVTTWADSGLTAATAYTYRVRATNAAGSSAFANEATATTSAAPVTAKPGDVNGDGSVNAADLNLVKSQFGRRSGDAGFLPACDLNLDGRIDSTDLSIVSRNQGR